ncbi:MAG: cell division protein FtsQ/DivIB [Anaerostipes sp.]|jgi:cell division protein FtsQ
MKNEEKIVQFKDAKKPKRKKNKIKIILGIIGVIIVVLIILGVLFQTKEIKITGNTYYTSQECKVAVSQSSFSKNTIVFYLHNRFFPKKSLPFIKELEVSLGNPGHMTISVKEKMRAGCIAYNGKYIYFDREGYALESSTTRYPDVPLVTGLDYKKIVMNQKLPEKDKMIFDEILRVTIAIDKYNVAINQIHFDEKKHMYLIQKNLTIDLYNDSDLEAKISELAGALPSLSGKKGTLSLKFYSKENPMMIFKEKKS